MERKTMTPMEAMQEMMKRMMEGAKEGPVTKLYEHTETSLAIVNRLDDVEEALLETRNDLEYEAYMSWMKDQEIAELQKENADLKSENAELRIDLEIDRGRADFYRWKLENPD
jgi:hypothetical protein